MRGDGELPACHSDHLTVGSGATEMHFSPPFSVYNRKVGRHVPAFEAGDFKVY